MKIILKDVEINVEVIRKNNKNIYFRFKDGNLIVTCNRFVTIKQIEELVVKNEETLYKMFLKNHKENLNDKFFNYLGKKYTIVYDNASKKPYFDEDMVFAKDEKVLKKFYDQECLRIFANELDRITPYFTDIPNFKWRVRKMKTRWGVNNVTDKVITLNTELLKKEPHLLDYVIIHELCHFYEANHSNKFWSKVAIYYPKYKEARKELRSE